MTAPLVRATATGDAYVGLDDPTWDDWNAWHRAMLDEREAVISRAGIDVARYDDPSTAWSDRSFRQVFLFLYDTSVYDRVQGRYRIPELLDRWSAMFGRVDSVLLWHAYPRLGFDARTQFDFYRDMPGGLAGLRAQVSDALHAAGVRVFVDYNPWDTGSYEELGEIVGAIDADGVMLDTMAHSPDSLARAVLARRPGVVFAPERRLRDADLGLRQSWAQWFDVGDSQTPSIYRNRWIVPRHRQFAIRRWDTSRKGDIAYSFFNGSGLLLWDNVFGAFNPYSRADRRLIAETAAILDGYEDLFARGEWLPLVPTGVSGLDANRWNDPSPAAAGRAITTLRNRTGAPVRYRIPSDAPDGMRCVAFWDDERDLRAGDTIRIEAGGVQAWVIDQPAGAQRAVDHFRRLSRRADVTLEAYEQRSPPPRATILGASPPGRAPAAPWSRPARWVEMPAGVFDMRVVHERRECGCYPFGATDDATWGWYYTDEITHELRVDIEPFAMRATAVTNGDFVAFVRDAGYAPADARSFLRHLARTSRGDLPAEVPAEQRDLPVTFVSLDDARAYAAWSGEGLPTEAQWQWAAEGAGAGRRYPWGDEAMTFPDALRPAFDPKTATAQGVMGLSGNAWELTESEYDDGHTRFVMLRGGVFMPPGESEWLPARGPRPNRSHCKYLLLSDGLDRSATVSFRTVRASGAGSARVTP